MKFKNALIKEYTKQVGKEGILLADHEIIEQLQYAMQRARKAEKSADMPTDAPQSATGVTLSMLEEIADSVWGNRKDLMKADPDEEEPTAPSKPTVPPLPVPTS